MMPAEWLILIFVIFVFGVIVSDAVYTILHRKRLQEKIREQEERILNDEGETKTIHAMVTNMACGVKSIGYQSHTRPEAATRFVITFKTKNGEEFGLCVPEDAYKGFEIGLTGMLTTVDDKLYGFVPDQEA